MGVAKMALACYMFYFEHKGKTMCLDSTNSNDEKNGFGRLFNHSRRRPNVHPIKCVVKGNPRLSFFSIADIEPGQELLWDYGDRDPQHLVQFPWPDL